MSFLQKYVGGPLIVTGNKVRIQPKLGGGYQGLTANEEIQSASWSGDDILVILKSGKALIYTTNAMYRYA